MTVGIFLYNALFIGIGICWIILGWIRIYRNIRYFQLEGYNSQRYIRWWLSNRQELRYTFISVVLILLISLEPFIIAAVAFLSGNTIDTHFDFSASRELII